MSTMARPSFRLLVAMEWNAATSGIPDLPNPAVRGGMATPVGATGE